MYFGHEITAVLHLVTFSIESMFNDCICQVHIFDRQSGIQMLFSIFVANAPNSSIESLDSHRQQQRVDVNWIRRERERNHIKINWSGNVSDSSNIKRVQMSAEFYLFKFSQIYPIFCLLSHSLLHSVTNIANPNICKLYACARSHVCVCDTICMQIDTHIFSFLPHVGIIYICNGIHKYPNGYVDIT